MKRRRKILTLLLTAALAFQSFSGLAMAETGLPETAIVTEAESDETTVSETPLTDPVSADESIKADEVNASYYTVRYDAKEGTDAPSSVRVNAGNSYTITGIPHYFAHNFMGWTAYTDDTAHRYLGSYSPKEKITVNSNIVLEAIWYRPEIISASDLDSGIYESTVSFPVANASRWYKITTPSEFSGWRFESESSENSSNMDPVITIYEADGTKVAEHDDCGMRDYDFCLDSHILYTDTTYYLEFSNGFLDRTASFALTIRKGYVISFLDKDRQNLPNLRTFKYHGIDAELPFDYPQNKPCNFVGWEDLLTGTRYIPGQNRISDNSSMILLPCYEDPTPLPSSIPTTFSADFTGEHWYALGSFRDQEPYLIKGAGSSRLSVTLCRSTASSSFKYMETVEEASYSDSPSYSFEIHGNYPMEECTYDHDGDLIHSSLYHYFLHITYDPETFYDSSTLEWGLGTDLTYNYNDTDPDTQKTTIKYDHIFRDKNIPLPVPQRAGYEFLGWFTKKTGGVQYTEYISATSKEYELFAHWKPVESPKLPFVDVPKDAYYYDAVVLAYENGIANGTDATHFSPNANCTRGQVVTFLWRAMGSPEPKTTVNPFVDVKSASPFYKAILWAYDNDITKGTDAKHFSPDAPVTRAQFVTFLWRNEDCPDPETTVNPFVDVDSSSGFYKAILWAYDNNITKGTDAKHFAPNQTCTRAQVIAFIYRAYFS